MKSPTRKNPAKSRANNPKKKKKADENDDSGSYAAPYSPRSAKKRRDSGSLLFEGVVIEAQPTPSTPPQLAYDSQVDGTDGSSPSVNLANSPILSPPARTSGRARRASAKASAYVFDPFAKSKKLLALAEETKPPEIASKIVPTIAQKTATSKKRYDPFLPKPAPPTRPVDRPPPSLLVTLPIVRGRPSIPASAGKPSLKRARSLSSPPKKVRFSEGPQIHRIPTKEQDLAASLVISPLSPVSPTFGTPSIFNTTHQKRHYQHPLDVLYQLSRPKDLPPPRNVYKQHTREELEALCRKWDEEPRGADVKIRVKSCAMARACTDRMQLSVDQGEPIDVLSWPRKGTGDVLCRRCRDGEVGWVIGYCLGREGWFKLRDMRREELAAPAPDTESEGSEGDTNGRAKGGSGSEMDGSSSSSSSH